MFTKVGMMAEGMSIKTRTIESHLLLQMNPLGTRKCKSNLPFYKTSPFFFLFNYS